VLAAPCADADDWRAIYLSPLGIEKSVQENNTAKESPFNDLWQRSREYKLRARRINLPPSQINRCAQTESATSHKSGIE
jgi:hypothetical protein